MAKKKGYKELILSNVKHFDDLEAIDRFEDNFIRKMRTLSESIEQGKVRLKINTVDYIVIKILNRKNRVYKFNNKPSFDVYVLGTFRKFFSPTYRVAQAFADFYLEIGILPNIIAVPKHILMSNIKIYTNKIRNGILIYERR